MSLLFTHAYYISDDLREQKIMKPYPPLGLLYVSAYMKTKQIENKVFDSTFSSLQSQLDFIQKMPAKLVRQVGNQVQNIGKTVQITV